MPLGCVGLEGYQSSILILSTEQERYCTDVETLPRIPFEISHYMEECTGEVSNEVLQTTYETVNSASKGKFSWITAVVNLQAQLDQLKLSHFC